MPGVQPCGVPFRSALLWRHNGRGSVSNHQPHDCLLNRLFRQIKESVKAPRHWPFCEFPAQMASNAENVSIWWRHHGSAHCIGQCVIPFSWCRSSCWQLGHGRMVNAMATVVGGEICLWDSEFLVTNVHSTPWSHFRVIGIYPAVSARTHVLMSPPYNIIIQGPGKLFPLSTYNVCPRMRGPMFASNATFCSRMGVSQIAIPHPVTWVLANFYWHGWEYLLNKRLWWNGCPLSYLKFVRYKCNTNTKINI